MKCKCCNKNDAIKYSKYTTGEFCSRECARAYSTKLKREEINIKIGIATSNRSNGVISLECEFCKKDFSVEWKRRNQKFCSISCASSWRNTELGIGRIAGLASVKSQSKNRRSKNEIYFSQLCESHFDTVLINEQMFNGWDADIIIEDVKVAILWNGKWHYEKITDKHSVEQVQNRDAIKIKEIKSLGYFPYVIKDMGKYKKAFVEKEFEIFLDYLKQKN